MVTQYLDELSTAAALSGSVNTVVNDNGRLIGHNTDGYGFWESLRRNNIEFVSKKATLVGPGGVGAAICVQGALDGLGEIAIFTPGRQVRKDCEGACRKDKREHLLQGRNVHDRG